MRINQLSFFVAIVLNCINCIVTEDITLNCEFVSDELGETYACVLRRISVTDVNSRVVIKGTHKDKKTDLDVNLVSIVDSNTPFIIPQIFSQFPNMKRFYIENSQLQSIKIPSVAQLEVFTSAINNIKHIGSGSFPNQTHLRYLHIHNSNVQTIAADAFVDLHSVQNLLLNRNKIQALPRGVLASLREVTLIDLSFNEFTTIHEGVFVVNNEKLRFLVLDNNQINEIHSNSFSNLRYCYSLIIRLFSNACANKAYSLNGEVDWLYMNEMLQPCIDNYEAHPHTEAPPNLVDDRPNLEAPNLEDQLNSKLPPAAVEKSIKIQFTGTLKLYDEAGNLIVEV